MPLLVCGKSWSQDSASTHPLSPGAVFRFTALCEALDTQPWRSCEIPSRELVSSRSLDDPTMTRLQHAACAACRGRPESVLPLDSSADETGDASRTTQAEADARRPGFGKAAGKANFAERAAGPGLLAGVAPLHRVVGAREKGESQRLSRCWAARRRRSAAIGRPFLSTCSTPAEVWPKLTRPVSYTHLTLPTILRV